jgi:hypothetical protein
MMDKALLTIFRLLGWEYDPRTGDPLPSGLTYPQGEYNEALRLYINEINREFVRANLFRPYMSEKHD